LKPDNRHYGVIFTHGPGGLLELMKYFGIISLFFILSAHVQAIELRVGIYENKPKVFTDEHGRISGFFVDILEEIARKEGWNLTYVPCEWPDCLDMLQAGVIDLMPDVAFTEERSQLFSFHTNAAAYSWLQVYRSPDVTIESMLDIEGKRVSLLEGSVQEKVLYSMIDGFGLNCELIPVSEMDQAFKLVSDGVADVAIVNHFFGNFHRYQYRLIQTPIVFHPDKLYFATRKGENSDVLATIDRYIEMWRDKPDSIYYDAVTRWMGEKNRVHVPLYVWWIIAGIVVMLLYSRWQVMHSTRELARRNKHLQEVLAEVSMLHFKTMQQERLKVLGQMVSGIAHDFNNILSMILGHAQLMKEFSQTLPRERHEEAWPLDVIIKAAKDGASMVQRMRDFAKSPEVAPVLEKVSLNEVVRDVIDLSRPRWDAQPKSLGVSINMNVELDPVPPTMGSPSELREALLNMILNAIDAMPDGGDLTVKCKQQNNFVVLQIADTGIGMSETVREKCLRPFYTTKENMGTGMGLTMVVSVMERHGGRLEIESKEGVGTTFNLIFPMVMP